MPEGEAQESIVGALWAGGGWLGEIREGCQWEADFEECVGFGFAQMCREAFLAKEITHAKVWRQELAMCFQEAEPDGRD